MSALDQVKKIKAKKMAPIELDPVLYANDIPQEVVTEKKAEEKHAVVAFTHANPPTEAHTHLANTVRYHSSKLKADPYLFLSRSENARAHPLPYSKKFVAAQDAFGKDVVHASQHNNLIDNLKTLHGKYDRVTIVSSHDKIPEQRREIQDLNGRNFAFKSIHFIGASKKDPDKKIGPLSSGKLRDAAETDDKKTFKSGLPKPLRKQSDRLYGDVRKGMGFVESADEAFTNFINS